MTFNCLIQKYYNFAMNNEPIILLTMLIDAIIRSQYEIVNVPQKYRKSFYVRLPYQNWFNPEKSQVNKLSKNKIWQDIKSSILVMFTDYKHLLTFLRINTWYVCVLYVSEGYVNLLYLIIFNLFFGLIFEIIYKAGLNE